MQARARVRSTRRAPPLRAGPWPPRPGWPAAPAAAFGAVAVGLALLAWTTRRALYGAPVADDYDFLARVRLFPPIDFFDAGGFPYYWRPLTRQVYYALLGDTLLSAPWVAGLLHAAALLGLALLLHRIAHRTLPAVPALCFAVLPLVAESARLLLVWPACAQPLFGATFAAGAVAAALGGHGLLAGAAVLAGLLSYEQSAWALPVVVAGLALAPGRRHQRLLRLAPTVMALVAWLYGLSVARQHGVLWPAAALPADAGAVLREVVAVVANVDLVPAPWGSLLLGAQVLVIAVALARVAGRRPAAGRAKKPGPPAAALAGCAALGLLGLVPALFAPGLWAPRHAFLPSLFVGFAVLGLCARAGRGFAPAWLGLRAIALLLAPAASRQALEAPLGDARTSFPELVRLQRIVESAHHALARPEHANAHGAAYWSLPLRSAVAFAGEKAPQVWSGDPTFHWAQFARPERSAAQVGHTVLAFDIDVTDPARVVDPAVIEDYFAATVLLEDNPGRIDSLLAAASRRNGPRPGPVLDEIERLRSGLAAMRGDLALAESLNGASSARYGTKAHHVAVAGWVAMARGDDHRARQLAGICLEREPAHASGLALRAALDARAARAAPAGEASRE